MQIPLLVRGRGRHASSADPLTRFRNVLHSARTCTDHGHSLRSAGLDTAQSIRQLSSIQDTLPRLPVSENFAAIQPHRLRCHPANALLNPLPGKPEISLYSFAGDSPKEILTGTYTTLHALAGKVRIERALIVITGIEEGVLTAANRDALWSGFGVPGFEQFLGLDGELLAYECEAHNGLHIVQRNGVWEEYPGGGLVFTSLTDLERPTLRLKLGLCGHIETKECDCGQPGPRVMNLHAQGDALP